ncbi:MAG: response regulator transcription factor [Thermoguttaceae bacterium]|nr:response regulator transcription factor [Thermoguttaceae bacterium]MDW8036760.1 response regulator transcription factor [Thermoguttaceae bacterium]
MPLERILVVDDEEEIQQLMEYTLTKEGYRVQCVGSGEMALAEVRRSPPDLVILDLMLPGMDGLEVCRRLRREPETAELPIVILSAKGEEADIVAGLELGADDYVTKPFRPRVLLARIRAVLRRRQSAGGEEAAPVRVGNLEIDPVRHEVSVGGRPVRLTLTEFRVLHALARRPGWVLTRQQIAAAVYGEEEPEVDRAIDVQIVALRKKLGAAARYIETVRGIGYRFKEPD